MSGSTWTWIGGTINVDSPTDWALTSGPGNASNIPVAGDTAINAGTLTGDGVIAAAVLNNGTVEASNNSLAGSSSGGVLEIQGAISGTGSMVIEPGATLQIDGALSAGQTIAFAPGAPETLIFGSPEATIANPITGLADGDKIEFSNGITVTGVSLVNGNTLAIGYHNAADVAGSYDLTDVTFAANAATTFGFGTDPANNDQNIMVSRMFTWVAASGGSFGTAGNWSFGSLVPGAGDFAYFNNGLGGTISGSGTVGVLYFYNANTWSLASGSSLSFTSNLNVGTQSPVASVGNLTIGSGSSITGTGFIDVGYSAGDTATLTIAGGGVLHETGTVDPLDYAMTIGASPASGTLAASSGSVVVTGAGSRLDLGSNGLVLGLDGGSGSLTVSLGGSVDTEALNSNVNDALGIGRLGDGTVTVTDPGSEVTATGDVYLAHSQTGSLLVENSGTFLAALDPTGLGGVVIGDGGTVGIGGTGIATITTNGVLDSQGFVTVGVRGTAGQLAVLNGGTVQVGTTLVVGTGGTIQNGLTEAGSGTLTIGAGGTVELTGGAQTTGYGATLGNANNSSISSTTTGVATVSGTGALLNLDGNGLAVAQYGNGSLTVSQGGSVATGTENSSDVAALAVGRQGQGTVTVSDPGSQLTVDGSASIGRAGTGSLIVENQGSVALGLDGTGVGGLLIGGQHAANSAGVIYLGGTGSATVTSGGVLSSQAGITVGDGGSSGFLSVTGGTVSAQDPLQIGGSASIATGGTLISPSGTVVAAGAIMEIGTGAVTVGAGGVLTVNQNGSTAAAIVLGDTAGATASLSVASGGTVIADGGLSVFQKGTVSIAAGGGLAIGGDGSINVAGTLTDAGTLTFGATLTDSGTFINESTLAGGATISGSGTLSNTAGALISGALTALAAGETVSNLGTLDGAVALAGGDRLVTGAGAVFGGGITGGTGGNTLEIASGPYALTDFDATGTPQYSTLQIDNGVSVTTDATDLLTGVTLVNNGTLDLGAFEAMGPAQNSGEITGDVTLASGVTLTNNASGTIIGASFAAIEALGPASVANSGVIDPAIYGVDLTAGGSVSNAAGGTIVGRVAGVLIGEGAGTVTNAGLISGGGVDAVTLAAGFANRVILDPGAMFTGLVDGGNTIGAGATSILELGSAFATGSLTGFGTEFVNFAQILVDPGASWTLAGNNSLAAGTTLTDQGQVLLSGTTMTGGALAIASAAGVIASGIISGAGDWSGMTQLVVGGAGIGALVVKTAGSVSATGADVAQSAGSFGDITVTGTQSVLTNTGAFTIGDAGLGALSVTAGGTVTTSAGAIIANTASASNSSANLTGAGSDWQIAGALTVGDAGFGSLSVSQSATVTAASAAEATAAGGDGVITVEGSNSALSLTGSLTVGSQGAGEVDILGGGTVTALDLTIGNANALSSGNVDVEGAGSTLNILSGGILNIGVAHGGSGILTIGTGATLSFAGTVVEAGQASYNNNGGFIDPDAVQFTSDSNSGGGVNQYDLYVENLGAVQITGDTGTWDTPMLLTGTSVTDAVNNISGGSLGQWQLGGGGTLVINANTVDAGQAVVFEDAGDTLVIGQLVNGGADGVSGQTPTVLGGAENLLQAGGFQAAIWGYQAGDQILFDNLAVTSDQIVNGNTLELLGSGNTDLGSLTFFTKAGNKALGVTAMAAAAAQMACFAAGTLIETPDGPRPVETLAVGDAVVTLLGGPGRIVWVGSRAVDCKRHPRPETVWPVRIAAGAFGANVPARDLWVSPDHAIYVDDVLIPAKHLVNGTTVCQVQQHRVVYHHVELERHDVVLAEGLPAETYLDTGDRAKFSGAAVLALHPDFSVRVLEALACAPVVVTGSVLASVRAQLMQRAAQSADDESIRQIPLAHAGCFDKPPGDFQLGGDIPTPLLIERFRTGSSITRLG